MLRGLVWRVEYAPHSSTIAELSKMLREVRVAELQWTMHCNRGSVVDYALKQRSYSDRFNCKIEGCYSGLCTINKRVAVLLLAGLLTTILLIAILLLVILLTSKEKTIYRRKRSL